MKKLNIFKRQGNRINKKIWIFNESKLLTNALNLDARCQRISGVARQARADGPHTAVDAVGADAAGMGPAGHKIVGDRAPMLVQVSAQVVSGIVVVVALTWKE